MTQTDKIYNVEAGLTRCSRVYESVNPTGPTQQWRGFFGPAARLQLMDLSNQDRFLCRCFQAWPPLYWLTGLRLVRFVANRSGVNNRTASVSQIENKICRFQVHVAFTKSYGQ